MAELTGLRDSTLKFYSEQGQVLPYHQAGAGLARRYERETAIERLKAVHDMQLLGMNIEIGVRDVLNAIFYVNRTGCQHLPAVTRSQQPLLLMPNPPRPQKKGALWL